MSTIPASLMIGDVPPAATGVNVVWLDNSPSGIQPSPGPASRTPIIRQDRAYESTALIQEPSVWCFGGLWHMYYAAGSVIGYASAPTPVGPWTKGETAVVLSGYAGVLRHKSVYVEGSTIYVFGEDSLGSGSFRCATGDMSNPLALTYNGSFSFDPGAPYRGGGLGNTYMIKRGPNDYFILWESSDTVRGLSWQIGAATATSPTGTWTIQQWPMPSLAPIEQTGPTPLFGLQFWPMGALSLDYRNGEYTLFYPVARSSSLGCDIFLATSPDGLNWTVQNRGWPWMRRITREEIDQTVDIRLVQSPGPDGVWWAFSSAMDNVSTVGYIMATPCSPTAKMWDGAAWVPILQGIDQHAAPGFNRLPVSTATAVTLGHLDEAPVNTTAAACTRTLPRAAVGAKVRIGNVGTGANAVTVAINPGDTLPNAGSALSNGQWATYECFVTNQWCRVT